MSKLAFYKNFTKHFFVLSSMKLCLSTTQFNVDNVDNLVYKSKALINTANLNVDKFVDNSFLCFIALTYNLCILHKMYI